MTRSTYTRDADASAAMNTLVRRNSGAFDVIVPNRGKVEFSWGDEGRGVLHALKGRIEKNGFTAAQAIEMVLSAPGTVIEGTLVESNGNREVYHRRAKNGKTQVVVVKNTGRAREFFTSFYKN